MGSTITFSLGWLGDVNLTESDLETFIFILVFRGMLSWLIQNQMGIFPDEFLDGRFDELVERVQLLRNQPFLMEERQNHGPAVLGRDAACIIIVQIRVVMLGLGHDRQPLVLVIRGCSRSEYFCECANVSLGVEREREFEKKEKWSGNNERVVSSWCNFFSFSVFFFCLIILDFCPLSFLILFFTHFLESALFASDQLEVSLCESNRIYHYDVSSDLEFLN